MKYTHWILALGLSTAVCSASAADLFEDGKLREIKPGDAIVATDTIGGYPIYQGEGKWKFESGSTSTATNSRTLTDVVPIGNIRMTQSEGGTFFARQSISANLAQDPTTGGWVGSPCGGTHLVARDKASGRNDNCMTIDPTILRVGSTEIFVFLIKLTNTGKSSRKYNVDFLLNPALIGFRGTGPGDWTQAAVDVSPNKQAFLAKLTAWAEKLQDSSIKAFDYSKPQDAFNGVESWRTLLPIPADLANQKLSYSFLSAVEDLKNRKAFAAIAYSPQAENRTRWSSSFGQPNQEEADRRALTSCDKEKDAGSPPCKLYQVTAAQ